MCTHASCTKAELAVSHLLSAAARAHPCVVRCCVVAVVVESPVHMQVLVSNANVGELRDFVQQVQSALSPRPLAVLASGKENAPPSASTSAGGMRGGQHGQQGQKRKLEDYKDSVRRCLLSAVSAC